MFISVFITCSKLNGQKSCKNEIFYILGLVGNTTNNMKGEQSYVK